MNQSFQNSRSLSTYIFKPCSHSDFYFSKNLVAYSHQRVQPHQGECISYPDLRCCCSSASYSVAIILIIIAIIIIAIIIIITIIIGGMGKECLNYHSRLAKLFAIEKGEDYAKTISWIRPRTSFALLKSALICLRGTRTTVRRSWDLRNTDIETENTEGAIY